MVRSAQPRADNYILFTVYFLTFYHLFIIVHMRYKQVVNNLQTENTDTEERRSVLVLSETFASIIDQSSLSLMNLSGE